VKPGTVAWLCDRHTRTRCCVRVLQRRPKGTLVAHCGVQVLLPRRAPAGARWVLQSWAEGLRP